MLRPLRPLRLTKLLLFTAGLLAFLATAELRAETPAGTKPVHCRVVWQDNPSTTATISWNTALPGEKHQVHYQEADGQERGSVTASRHGAYWGSQDELHFHHAKLIGLKPDTKYVVLIESDGQPSRPYYFLTAPDDMQPIKLLFGGDSRSDQKSRRQMNEKLAELVTEQPDILALVHGGDYIASGLSFRQWAEWMDDHTLTTGKDGRLLPIIPARGNHDIGDLLNQVFNFPAGDGIYYGVSFGPLLRLVTLNTEISTAGDQARWLEDELAAARPEHRWLVTQYHRPAYPAVKSPSSARRHWVPLFEKYNVDLVCEADGHSIKRTLPIRDDKHDPTGVVYIGEGGLGVGQRTPNTSHWYLQPPAKVGKGHHVQLLSISKDRLEYQAILLSGEIFDQHTLEPR